MNASKSLRMSYDHYKCLAIIRNTACMNDRECLRTPTNVWRSLCDHCELVANCIRKPIRHSSLCERSIRNTCITILHNICVPLPILSLSGVDRHDCLSPSFSVLCQLWVELVLFQIAPHSVQPRQAGPSSRSLPSHLYFCYMFCNIKYEIFKLIEK